MSPETINAILDFMLKLYVVIAFAFVMYAVAAIATYSWYKEFLKPA